MKVHSNTRRKLSGKNRLLSSLLGIKQQPNFMATNKIFQKVIIILLKIQQLLKMNLATVTAAFYKQAERKVCQKCFHF